MNGEGGRKFMTKMAQLKLRIPNMDKMSICCVNDECGPLPQFLLHCVPHSLKDLSICVYPYLTFCCDPYCYELTEAIKRVTERMRLSGWVMNGSTFEAIFKAESQASELSFHCCQIDSSGKLDLDGPEYKWVVFHNGWCIINIR